MSNKVNAKIALALCCTLWGFMLNSFDLSAQNTPVSLNYQAVARNNAGEELKNTNLKVRISILANTANGDVAWEEDHQVTTNNFGLFTLNIGAGNKTAGTASSLKNIEWGRSAHFLKVEIDFGDGTLKHMGTTQMLAVPYAFYAETSGNTEPDFSKFGFDEASNTLKNEGQTVADLSPLKQTLIYDPANYHLSISGMAGVVDLRDFLYTPQDLRTADDKLWITGNKDSTIVELKPYKQTLSVNSNSRLEISNGNSVTVDTSNINEIQGLSLINNELLITDKPTTTKVDLTKYLDNTDNQVLRKINDKLELSNSGGRLIPIDTSLVNELQNLVKVNGRLILSNSTARGIPVDTSDTNESITSVTYNQSTNKITINEGTNSKEVTIAPKQIAFRYSKHINNSLNPGEKYLVKFLIKEQDDLNVYDFNTGIFTVPPDGAGLYCFFTNFAELRTRFSVELLINDINPKPITSYNQPLLLKLNANDQVKIQVISNEEDIYTLNKGTFVGYRLN